MYAILSYLCFYCCTTGQYVFDGSTAAVRCKYFLIVVMNDIVSKKSIGCNFDALEVYKVFPVGIIDSFAKIDVYPQCKAYP